MVTDTVAKGTNITTQTTTLVKSGSGILSKIVFNKALANGTVAIYDDVTAVASKLKGTITIPAAVLASQFVLDFEMRMETGITIVTGAANQDITVLTK